MPEEQKILAQPTPVRAAILPDPIWEYLLHVFEKHVQQGIPSKELGIAFETHKRLNSAQPIDFSQLGPTTLEKLGDKGVSVHIPELEPSERNI